MKVISIIILIIPSILGSLTFIELEDHIIPGVSQASLDWGDFDNSGYRDLLITGHTGQERISRVYKNNGNNTFTYQGDIELTGVNNGSGIWGDLNNDGYLDIVISGYTDLGEIVTTIYENDGNGGYTELLDLDIPGVRYCSLNLVDFNSDGWLDIFIAGFTGSESIARLYENSGNNVFVWREDIIFPGFRDVSSCWGDVTGNGYPDLIVSGEVDGAKTTSLYMNLNGSEFSLEQNTGLPGVYRGSVALGDFAGNGFLDLLITGISDTGRVSQVYQNTGSGNFNHLADLTGIGYGQGIWADLNNNGHLDIFITGAESGTYNNIAEIYVNSGNNSFNLASDIPINGLSTSAIAVTDMNNNGKTDLVTTGLIYAASRETLIYLNDIPATNSIPIPPVNLTTMTNNGHVTLIWSEGSDLETATSGLSYNIWLRPLNQPELQLMAPMSDFTNGMRRVTRPGNAGQSNQFSLSSLPAGNYEWAVQTIDSALTGSDFSSWCSFTHPSGFLPSPANLQIIEDYSQVYISWDPVEGATMYRIYGSSDPYASEWALIDTTESTDWAGPVSHTSYFYRVSAVAE